MADETRGQRSGAGALVLGPDARGLARPATEQQHDLGAESFVPLLAAWERLRPRGEGTPSALLDDGVTHRDGTIPMHELQPWLALFRHVRLPAGLVLDWVYLRRHHDSSPLLYVREREAPQLRTVDEYLARFSLEASALEGSAPNPLSPWLPHVLVDPTPLGWLELALLVTCANQFYLFWHARYKHFEPLLTRAGRDRALRDLPGFYNDADRTRLDAEPPGARVTTHAAGATVRLLARLNHTIVQTELQLALPNLLVAREDRTFLPPRLEVLY